MSELIGPNTTTNIIVDRPAMSDEKLSWEWRQEVEALKQQLADYQEVHEDKQRLVRKLDVIWNGEAGAATQASLCDLVAQIAKELPDIRQQLATARQEA